MSNYFIQAGSFLISTLVGFYIILVMLRFLLQVIRADFYNPFSQFIVKVTNPPLLPIRQVVPGMFGLDVSSLVLAYVLQIAELLLLSLLKGVAIPIFIILWLAIGKLVSLVLYIYLFAIIIQAVMSWINPNNYNPITALIHQITEPVLRPARNMLPPFSGIDFSPLLVIIVINLMIMMVPYLFH